MNGVHLFFEVSFDTCQKLIRTTRAQRLLSLGTRPEPPGPIDNTILLQPDGAPKPGLKRGVDYRGVTKEVWDYFVSIYSGGPTITRKRIDIYEPHCTPPEELMLGRK